MPTREEIDRTRRRKALELELAQAQMQQYLYTQKQPEQQAQSQAMASGRPIPPEQPTVPPDTDWKGAGKEAVQGLTWGTSDEIGVLAAALVAKVTTGDDFPDIYMSMRDSEAQKRKEFKESEPNLAVASEIGGALMSGVGLYNVGRELAAGAGSKISQIGAKKRLQKTMQAAEQGGKQGKGLQNAMAGTLNIGKGQTGQTLNRKMERVLTNIAAASGVGGVEAFIYAFNSADGGLEDRMEAGTQAAKTGVVAGGVLGTASEGVRAIVNKVVKPRLAQSLGEGDDFVPIPVAAPRIEGPAAAYDSLIKNAYGSKVGGQTEDLIARVKPQLDDAYAAAQRDVNQANIAGERGAKVAKDTRLGREESTKTAIADEFRTAKRAVEGETDELKRSALAKTTAQLSDASKNAEKQVIDSAQTSAEMQEAARLQMQNKLFDDAAPPTATAEERALLQNPDPQIAMKALEKLRSEKGFTSLEGLDWMINQDDFIKKALKRNAGDVGLSKSNKAIKSDLEGLFGNRIVMPAKDLMAIRNQLRTRVNSAGQSGDQQAKEAYRRAAQAIDKEIKTRLDTTNPELSKLYDAELKTYGKARMLEDASEKAIQKDGELTPENVLSVATRRSGWATGEATGQAVASETKKLQKSIEAQHEARTRAAAYQKEQAQIAAKAEKQNELVNIAATRQEGTDNVLAQKAQAETLRKREARSFADAEKQAKQPQVTVKTADKGESGVRQPHMQQTAAEQTQTVLNRRADVPTATLPRIASTLALPAVGALAGYKVAGPLGGLLGGIVSARGLSSQPISKLVVGDTEAQKRIAEMLRKDPHSYGRGAVLRPSINQMLDDEDERKRRAAMGGY